MDYRICRVYRDYGAYEKLEEMKKNRNGGAGRIFASFLITLPSNSHKCSKPKHRCLSVSIFTHSYFMTCTSLFHSFCRKYDIHVLFTKKHFFMTIKKSPKYYFYDLSDMSDVYFQQFGLI